MAIHEIFDMDTGDLVAWKNSEADILAFVRDMMATYGVEVVRTWSLSREDNDDGESIAEGRDLIKLVEREVSAA